MKTIFIFATCIMLVGCTVFNENVSLNQQRSLSRCAGDIGATTILEVRKDVTPEKILELADIITDVVENSDMETLNREELLELINEQLEENGLEFLNRYAIQVVNNVPEGMSLVKGKIIIIEICKGLTTGAEEFKYEGE